MINFRTSRNKLINTSPIRVEELEIDYEDLDGAISVPSWGYRAKRPQRQWQKILEHYA
jgi:hypothetical protein